MKLIEIYRARYDGRTEEALAAAAERISRLEIETSLRPGPKINIWTALMHIKGDCYLDLHRYTDAEECFNQVFVKTGSSIALANRGYSRWVLGRNHEAKQDYITSLKTETDDEEREIRLRNLSEICMELRDLSEAEMYLDMAIKIGGDSFDVMDIRRDLMHARRKIDSSN